MEMDLHERLKAAKIVNAGGGGEPPVFIEKEINQNGTYIALDDEVDGYSKVTVDVPNTYTAQDEGKVVDNGALVAQTAMSSEVTENGTVDTTLYNSVTVNVNDYKSTLTDLIEGDIVSIDIPDTVTSIGYAFQSCQLLRVVKIPSSITSIPDNAFYNCSSLKIISIPNSVTSIGMRAFYKCASLKTIIIPSSVTSIGFDAFSQTALETITINKPEDSISGAPWGATAATIEWTG